VVAGDVTDPKSLEAALRGARGVIFAASGTTYCSAKDVDYGVRLWLGRLGRGWVDGWVWRSVWVRGPPQRFCLMRRVSFAFTSAEIARHRSNPF